MKIFGWTKRYGERVSRFLLCNAPINDNVRPLEKTEALDLRAAVPLLARLPDHNGRETYKIVVRTHSGAKHFVCCRYNPRNALKYAGDPETGLATKITPGCFVLIYYKPATKKKNAYTLYKAFPSCKGQVKTARGSWAQMELHCS